MPVEMDISVVGISHHTAPVALREALALPGDLPARLLRALRTDKGFEEALVLDTCNRTEVYFLARETCEDPQAALLAHVARLKDVAPITDTTPLYVHHGRAATEHLFRVAAALDSQIVGEHQILGQVKEAYRLAVQERTAKFFLNRLLHCAFRVGKRVRTETGLGRGTTSVAQAAVDLSRQVFTSLTGKSVLLVGAGETGTLTAKSLIAHGVGSIVVANRTVERARAVAEEVVRLRPRDAAELDVSADRITCPALLEMMAERGEPTGRQPAPAKANAPEVRAIGLDELPDVIGRVDLVLCATGAPGVVLKADQLARAIARSGRSLFIVDIAVPRDVDPALDRLDNVFLYNLDDLDRVVAQNIEGRRREIPRAQAIVDDELGQFTQWRESLHVTPTIKLLQEHVSRLREAEIKRYGSKFDKAHREQLEQFTRSLCNKILHQPMAFLRDLSDPASSGNRLAGLDLIHRIFDLDQTEDHS